MPSGLLDDVPENKKSQIINNLEQSYQILYSGWNRFTQHDWDPQALENLIREALEVSTFALEYKLIAIAKSAKELVMRLRSVNSNGNAEPSDERLIVQIMDKIKSDIFALKPDNIVKLHPQNHKSTGVENPEARIGLLEGDERIALDIQYILEEGQYAVEIYDSPELLKEDMAERKFDLVIVDLLLPNCPLASAMAVEEFLSNNPIDVPVIMLSEQADLATRLIALRAGIKTYLTKPIEEEELLEKVKNILAKRSESRRRILVVDDDPMLTEYYETALGEEGFIVKTVNDPIELLSAIDEFKPHVITLDYMMPGCNGLEAAEILRGDPRYMKIPIVFMSASDEALQRKGLMGIFGNAFLEKPVDIDRLSGTLNEIAAKSQKINENFEKISKRTDSNHLENRDYFFNHLQTSLEDRIYKESIDKNHYLMLATMDNIPLIKENHGSLALMKLEEKVEHHFSKHPLIDGRGCKFGEHAFLLLIEDEHKDDPEMLFKRIHDSFRTKEFLSDPAFSFLTFSVGVIKLDGTLPPSMDETIQLVESAGISASNAGGDQLHWAATHKHSTAPSEKVFQALKSHSFQLAFQSIVKPDGDEQIFEVLVRLADDDGEIYTPEKFLPYIDDAIPDGSYHLDRWVIENAFRALETTSGRGAAEYSIVIKLTPDLRQVDRLMPFIFNIISNTRLRGVNRIYFSLNEKAVLKDLRLANTLIEALHTAGCGFIIEHCEANERSVSAIHQLNRLDFVKLDPVLSDEKGDLSTNRKRISEIQKAMKNKGQVIAGLVEDAKTFAHFWDMEIRYFQGFFIHRPNTNMSYQAFAAESLVLER